MRRIVPVVLIAWLSAGTAHAVVEGRWTSRTDEKPGRIYLELSYGRTQNTGTVYDVSAFTGLSAEAIRGKSPTPASFALDREAGRVAFEGSFNNGRGSGHFTFAPDPGYFDKVRAMGVEVSGGKQWHPSTSRDERLLFLALFDVSTGYIRSMIAEGYEETLDTYQNMRLFDVTPTHVHELRSLGFKELSAGELVATRIHGITPEYVREMRAAGWNLSLSELQNAAIFNVTPAFREEMAKLGYRLSLEKLTAFRIHGVTPEWIAELKKLGYGGLSADDLVSSRIFQLTPEFIRSLRDAGYHDVPMRDLISMKVQGLDVRSLSKRRAL